MTIRSPGQITIDGVDFELLRRGEGFAWDQYDQAVNPGGATPEEGVLATKPPSFLRTSGFLDWSHGAGASVYRPGETRFHWSDGPSGELPARSCVPTRCAGSP